MTTGKYLSKINTRTFFYGYFQQQKKLKNMHFGKKNKKKTTPVNHLNAILDY